MRSIAGILAAGLLGLSSLLFASCGGGGGGGGSVSGQSAAPVTPASSNVASIIIDSGPDPVSNPAVNTLYTTVTVCLPGSTTACQTIDHIQVDTGSYGLRILASALTLSFSAVKASDGNSLAECTQFVDGYSWGPIALADIQVAGEVAASVPIQIIGSSSFAAVPANCSATGKAEDTVAAFGANGILGIGAFAQDCGSGCVDNPANTFYFSCATSTCTGIAAPLTSQVLNPVPLFPTDNNGSIIILPSVPDAGAVTVTGSLIFGIDTRANNASGSETILALDGNGNFTTQFNGQPLTQSFVDSGTNGTFFNDSSLPRCAGTNFPGFYCLTPARPFTATLTGAGAVPATTSVTFTVGNPQTLLAANPNASALPTLAGTYSTTLLDTFDWGLPFFFNRRVITAIDGQRTAVSTGPYVAF